MREMQHSQKQLSHNTENFIKQTECCHNFNNSNTLSALNRRLNILVVNAFKLVACLQVSQAVYVRVTYEIRYRTLMGINIKTYGQRMGVRTPVRR